MIVDKIENSLMYECLHLGFALAFEFIKNSNFGQLEDGKYEIDNDNIFAIVQEYNTKDKKEAKLESHHKYIDIQYIHSGYELVGVTPLINQKIISDDPKKDLVFYQGEVSFIKLEARMFAIFFPDDLHMPGIKVGESEIVKKVVIKVKL